MSVQLVYATFPDRTTAEETGTEMVEEGLAACVTHWEAGTVYRWEGEVTYDEESLALFKTHPELRDELVEALVEDHPYEVPCVLPVDSEEGAPGYEDWIRSATQA